MQAAIGGIATIWVVIGVGWLLAHGRVVDGAGQRTLSMVAFTVASPALMFSMVSRASLDHLFSLTLAVSVLAIAVAGGAYLAVASIALRRRGPELVIGFMASCYSNAANFGLPVALALLGDATWIAPILLLQVAVIMPVCLALLDLADARASGRRLTVTNYLLLPVRNPITVGILAGLAANLAGLQVPEAVMRPVEMVGAMAVPLMLLAFGASLRLEPLPGTGPHTPELTVAMVCKIVAHPVAAWLLGRAFGLQGHDLYAVVVLAALPCAQNVHVVAMRYACGERLGRDAVFWSTILSVVGLLVAAALLGP